MLDVAGLTHAYDGTAVLDDVHLSVARGELVSIVGPSGCGKSTLLRCIAGLTRPDAGKILVDGAPVTGIPPGLAVVFQEYGRSLLPWLSVRENVALPLRRTPMSRVDRRSAALSALDAVGLGGSGSLHPGQLSGGMQQRVAIARALVCRPRLLLMDEPFGSVDAQTREDLEDLLLSVRTPDTTILLVTHDIDESVYVGDRVIVLGGRPGHVTADLPVTLPSRGDQITTRAAPEFVRLRTEVGRHVRSNHGV